jgi:MraZ protein
MAAMIDLDMGLYAGTYEHTRDAKGRLTVPSKWRFDGDDDQTFLAFFDPMGCITVYPPKMVAQLKQKLSQISVTDVKGQLAAMRFLKEADSFKLDKSGRVKINEALYQKAGIDREVTCCGGLNTFHFWEPERYNQTMGASDAEGGNLLEVLGSLGL